MDHASIPPGDATGPPQRVSEETDHSANSYIIELMERSSQDSRGSHGSNGSRGRRAASPFADATQQSTPIPRDSMEDEPRRKSAERARSGPTLDSVDERFATRNDTPTHITTPRNTSLQSQPSPGTRMAAFHDYRQQIGTRSAMSLDQPRPPRPPRHRAENPLGSQSSELRISMDLPANIGTQLGHPTDEMVRARLTRKRRRLPLPWVIGFGVVSSCCLVVALTTLSIGIYNFTKLRQNRAQKSIQNLEDDLMPLFEQVNNGVAAVQLGLATLLGQRAGVPGPPQGP